jgi:hypothetical protein
METPPNSAPNPTIDPRLIAGPGPGPGPGPAPGPAPGPDPEALDPRMVFVLSQGRLLQREAPKRRKVRKPAIRTPVYRARKKGAPKKVNKSRRGGKLLILAWF